jgi:RHS repeat-associated protein
LSLRAAGSVVSTSGSNTITWYYLDNGTAVQIGSPYTCSTSCNFDVTRTANARVTNWDSLYGKITFTENGNTHVMTTLLALTYAPGMAANTKYGYSSDGLRTSVSPTNASRVYYGYDPIGLGSPPEPVGEFLGGQLKNQTFYDAGADAPLERTVSGVNYNIHRDGLGSVTSITNASQGLQTSYRYDPYGVQVQAAGAVPSPLRYTGREWDTNDGLEYSRARYYDPSTGRFLSKDPSGMVDGTNLYAYAGNNPVGKRDPTGHMFYQGDNGGGGAGNGGGGNGPQLVPRGLGESEGGGTSGSNSVNKLTSIECISSILFFAAGIVLAFLGIYVDIVGLSWGLRATAAGWGLDIGGIFTKRDWGSLITLLVDIGIWAFEEWSKSASWFDFMWVSAEEGAKLTPFGIAIEVGLMLDSAATGLPALIHDCFG